MRDDSVQRIHAAVYDIFDRIHLIRFPLDASDAVKLFENCRYMSNKELEEASGSTHDEVIRACESYDGCTKYDPNTKRYLILANRSPKNIISRDRINWTIAHELGHILCGHFDLLVDDGKAISSEIKDTEVEAEADFFAASLLAPLPALCSAGVRNVEDVRKYFGLSQQAAEYRFAELRRYLDAENGPAAFWGTQKLSVLFRKKGIHFSSPLSVKRKSLVPKIRAIDIIPDKMD